MNQFFFKIFLGQKKIKNKIDLLFLKYYNGTPFTEYMSQSTPVLIELYREMKILLGEFDNMINNPAFTTRDRKNQLNMISNVQYEIDAEMTLLCEDTDVFDNEDETATPVK